MPVPIGTFKSGAFLSMTQCILTVKAAGKPSQIVVLIVKARI